MKKIIIFTIFVFMVIFSFSQSGLNLKVNFSNTQIFLDKYYSSVFLDYDFYLNENIYANLEMGLVHDGLNKNGSFSGTFDQKLVINSGYLSFQGKNFYVKGGLMTFDEGMGNEYKLFFRKETGSFPGVSYSIDFLDHLNFKNDFIFININTPGIYEKSGDLNFAKSVYYRSLSYSDIDWNGFPFTIGYHESMMLIDENIQIPYMVIPLPYPVTQDLLKWAKHPININAMLGFFWETYINEKYHPYLDILIDDFSFYTIFKPEEAKVIKMALNSGFDYISENYQIGSEFAIGNSYVFERTAKNWPYEYTRYIEEQKENYFIEKNMLGYKYGEDAASLFLYFDHDSGFSISNETVLLGVRTPWSPWHGESTYEKGIHFFLGGIEEIRNILNICYSVDFEYENISLNFKPNLGIALINKSENTNFKPLFGIDFSVSF